MHKYYKWKYLLWIIFLISWIIDFVVNKGQSQSMPVLINIWMVVLLVTSIRHYRFWNKIIQDEMTKKLAYISLAAAFQLTLIWILVVWWIDYLHPITMSLNQFISILFLFMMWSSFLMRHYYYRKIDKI